MRIALSLLLVTILLTACDRPRATTQPAPQTQAAAKPQSKDKLLLLDEDTPSKSAPEDIADNSRCQVCHLNIVIEELAIQHANAKIGCADCHGACDAHIADESWASGGNGTAPDKMFPTEKINPLCYSCHTREKLDADLHKTFLAGVSEQKQCTGCHGKHKLVTRKCKWK